MYASDSLEIDYVLLPNVCNVCLSANRRTFPLGEYYELYNRRLPFTDMLTADTKLCWECLAILKKLRQFETKCYIAQKILHSQVQQNTQESLSTLSIAPTKVFDVTSNAELSDDDAKGEVKVEFNVNDYNNINYDTDYSEAPVMKVYEEITEHNADDVRDFDCTDDEKDTKPLDKIKDEESENKAAVELKEESSEISLKAKVKKEPGTKVKYSYRFGKKDLEGQFRIVRKEEVRYEKVPINADELKAAINEEMSSDFFKKNLHKCYDCVQCFQNLKLMKKHHVRLHDESKGKYACEWCKARLPSASSLKAHVPTHFYIYQCSSCSFKCYSRRRIKLHVKHHMESVECVHCSMQFLDMNEFSSHYKKQHSVFICDQCGKKSKTKYSLEKHMIQHSAHVCRECDREYKTRKALQSHVELRHTRSARELCYCAPCDKQYQNAPLYRQHLLSSKAHAQERGNGRGRAVGCPLCDRVYSRRTYMMNHYRHVHLKQSKHYCEDCDKHFLNRTRYVEHRKYLHEGGTKVKNKMCNVCGRAFAANRTLINHMRTHSGERPYECEQCSASFTQKHCLVTHVKHIHLKIKRGGGLG